MGMGINILVTSIMLFGTVFTICAFVSYCRALKKYGAQVWLHKRTLATTPKDVEETFGCESITAFLTIMFIAMIVADTPGTEITGYSIAMYTVVKRAIWATIQKNPSVYQLNLKTRTRR